MFQLKSLVLAVLGVVFAFFACGSLLAQVQPPELEWERNFGGDGDEWAVSVKQTLDGGYIIVGNLRIWPSVGNVYIVKTDWDGNMVWDKKYGDVLWASGSDILQTGDGRYVIVGGTQSPNDADILFMKINSLGDIIWDWKYGDIYFGYSILETPENHYVVSGNPYLMETDSEGVIIWRKNHDIDGYDLRQTYDGGYVVFGGRFSAQLLKTNKYGKWIWSKFYQINNHETTGLTVLEAQDHGFILAGETWGKMFILKTNEAGEIIWQKTYPNVLPGRRDIIQKTPNNEYVAIGRYVQDGTRIPVDAYLFKIDAQGNILWEKRFGGNTRSPLCLQITNDGGYVIAGAITVGSGPTNNGNFYLAKFAPEGIPVPPSQVAANIRTERSIGISWQDNSAIETGFILERKLRSLTQEGGAGGTDEWQEIAKTQENITQYIDPVLPPEHEVTYRIAAVNNNGTSARISSQPIPTPTPSPERPWQLKIYRQTNPDKPETGQWVDLTSQSQFHSEWKTVVITHGYQGFIIPCLKPDWLLEVAKKIYARLNKEVNIIAWEWIEEACKLDSLLPQINPQAYNLNNSLRAIFTKDYNLPIHLLGHSFGGHLLAFCAGLLTQSLHGEPIYNVGQLTLWDPQEVFVGPGDLDENVRTLRSRGVYVELYDGCFNEGTHNVNLWVDTPRNPLPILCHFVYDWYMSSIPTGGSPPLYRTVCSTTNVYPGTVGFGTSVLLPSPSRPLPPEPCLENGTIKFGKVFCASLLARPLVFLGAEDCQIFQPPTQWSTPDTGTGRFFFSDDGKVFNDGCSLCNANSIEVILNLRRAGQGGGAQEGSEFVARYDLRLEVVSESDYLSFNYNFAFSQTPSTLWAYLMAEGEILPVFSMFSDTVPEATDINSNLLDIRELHGKSITLRFELHSKQDDAQVTIGSLTFWKDYWNGNQAPVADAGEDQTFMVECNQTTIVTLDGEGTTDPDVDDEHQYFWIYQGEILAVGEQVTIELPAGIYPITLEVRDSADHVASDGVTITINTEPCPFIRGDSNTDKTVDISDAINTLGWLFLGTGIMPCKDAGDANDSGDIDISDPIYILGFLFTGVNTTIPAPYPQMGEDTTDDLLNCERY